LNQGWWAVLREGQIIRRVNLSRLAKKRQHEFC
jgi:hypothetical protein